MTLWWCYIGETGVRKRKSVQEQGGAVGRSIDTDVYKELWLQQEETVHIHILGKGNRIQALARRVFISCESFLAIHFFSSPPCSFFILANLVLQDPQLLTLPAC
jgi:hypothetical protein